MAYFFCTFLKGGFCNFRLFSRKKGGKEAENKFPPFFLEKGRKIDFPPGRTAEGGGRFLPGAHICANNRSHQSVKSLILSELLLHFSVNEIQAQSGSHQQSIFLILMRWMLYHLLFCFPLQKLQKRAQSWVYERSLCVKSTQLRQKWKYFTHLGWSVLETLTAINCDPVLRWLVARIQGRIKRNIWN